MSKGKKLSQSQKDTQYGLANRQANKWKKGINTYLGATTEPVKPGKRYGFTFDESGTWDIEAMKKLMEEQAQVFKPRQMGKSFYSDPSTNGGYIQIDPNSFISNGFEPLSRVDLARKLFEEEMDKLKPKVDDKPKGDPTDEWTEKWAAENLV